MRQFVHDRPVLVRWILWLAAVAATVGAFMYQDKTGPTYPLEGELETASGPGVGNGYAGGDRWRVGVPRGRVHAVGAVDRSVAVEVRMDFSESGMAFECVSDFPIGEKLLVSFVDPKNRCRFSLKSEVIRKTSTPTGSAVFYGVTFRQLSDEDSQDLTHFNTGSS